jgi:uncharacterized protein YciI
MSQPPLIYYAVTLDRGENWNPSHSMREQEQWDEHAKLMNAFVDDGFIILGGPLEDGEHVLMIINAESRSAIAARLAEDPWLRTGVRRISTVERWEILLGAGQ